MARVKLIPWGSLLSERVEGERQSRTGRGPVCSLDMYQAAWSWTWNPTPPLTLLPCMHITRINLEYLCPLLALSLPGVQLEEHKFDSRKP